MSVSIIMRKIQIMLSALFISATLSGCVLSLDRAVGGLFEAVVETTVDAVGDIVVDVSVELIEASAEVLIDSVFACIDNDKPVIRGALPNPVLNQEYGATVQVSIRNEPYDNAYHYDFEVFGELPPGIRFESTGRQLRLVGKPITPGEYDFGIKVTVRDNVYGARNTRGLCFTVDNESFRWSIEQNEYTRNAL